MGSRVSVADAAGGLIFGLITFSMTLVLLSTVVSTGLSYLGGAAMGFLVGLAVVLLNRSARERQVRDARSAQADVVRELMRKVVPTAAELATDGTGRLDPERFQDLVVGSIAAATDPQVGLVQSGPAVWEVDGSDARTPEQEQRFQRLMAYPGIAEAPALLALLDGMGPQTVQQFAVFAIHARSRLAVGLESVVVGPAGAALTGHLIAAGLVEQVDRPAPAMEVPGSWAALYALTPTGLEVARLFSPVAARPQELAALDPVPLR